MKKLQLFAAILLLSITSIAFGQGPPTMKILQEWYYTYDPSGTPPTAFKPKTHLWNNTVLKKSFIYDGTWIQVEAGHWTPGPQGIQGVPGAPGQSITGPAGANGQAATITVGATTTLPAGSNATVTNTGTSTNAVLNFGIPQGNQGVPGSGGGGAGGIIKMIGSIKFCYTEQDFRDASAGILSGNTTWIIVCDTIFVYTEKTPLNLPKGYFGVDRQVIISGAGCRIYDKTNTGLPYILGMQAVDQTEANNLANNPISYKITDLGFVGTKKGDSTGVCINLSGSQFADIDNCFFNNAKQGVNIKWCMFSRVTGNRCTDIYNVPFYINRGDWPGSINNNSSSNHTILQGNRVFNYDGAFAAYQVYACSGVLIDGNTSEGGSPKYVYHLNNQAANEVKVFTVTRSHIESRPTVAAFYVRISQGGQVKIEDVNFQLFDPAPITMIEAVNGGGANTLIIKNITYIRTQDVFKSESGFFWQFENCSDGGNLLSQSHWIGAIPNGVSTYNNGTSLLTVKRP